MPTLSEVTKNAKKLKGQIAEQAGIAPKDVSDQNLLEAQKLLHGAGKVGAAGGDPLQTDPSALKAAADGGEPVQENPDKISKQQKIALAITAIAPTLLGYAFGGSEGGAVGAQVSQKAIGEIGGQIREEDKFKRDLAARKDLKKMEVDKDLAIAGERAQDRHQASLSREEDRKFRQQMLSEGMADRRERENERRRAQEEKVAYSKTTQGKLEKLSKEKQDSVYKAKEAVASVQGMADALDSGNNTFSIVGDNEYTRNRTLFEEALGRMQSGGAITKDEERRFRDMAPTFRDSGDMQKKKLVELEKLFQERLEIMGFKPEELGVSSGRVQAMWAQQPQGGGVQNPMMPTANAAPREKALEDMSEQELEAHIRKLKGK